MVFVLDEGGMFDAPLKRIWELNRSKTYHRHPGSMKNMKVERTADPLTIVLTWDSETHSVTFNHKARLTFLPPVGFTMDFVEGPLVGSRDIEYYLPNGDKTGITCVGEWKWTATAGVELSQDELKALVAKFYDEGFQEDKENLVRMEQESIQTQIAN